MLKKCDAVFEGGGVKGIGLAGAVEAIEKAGYEFVNLAGTSAGAIVASLLAVGYTGGEIKDELRKLDFDQFRKEDFLSRTGPLGKLINILLRNGIYRADCFESWLAGLLRRKGKLYFSDIRLENAASERYAYKFQAIASDLSEKRMLVLPQDLKDFGIDPDSFSIAKAVRMSMSIPIYYEPYILKDGKGKAHVIVDGGLLSNYPIWLLDDNTENPPWPTIGFKFSDDNEAAVSNPDYHSINNTVDFIKSLVTTAIDAHDKHYISTARGDYQRSIMISPKINTGKGEKSIGTVNFDITKSETEALYKNGFDAAQKFLSNWDFNGWKRKYRNAERRRK